MSHACALTLVALLSLGKPSPPVQVRASVSGEVDADRWQTVTFELTVERGLEGLTTQVRGLDGIEVRSEPVSHGKVESGQALTRTAEVRAPKGKAGYLVVDLGFIVQGRRSSAVVSFALSAKGASYATPTIGERSKDSAGRPLILMKAAEPKK